MINFTRLSGPLKLKERILQIPQKALTSKINETKGPLPFVSFIDYVERKEIAYQNNKIKSIIDFDDDQANRIKSLAVEVKSNVAITTRFMKGKMPMFPKTSLKGFVYDMIDVFMYADGALQKIYKKQHQDKTCKLYQNLTDSDNTSLTFVFICNHENL